MNNNTIESENKNLYFEKQTWKNIFQNENIVDYPIVFVHGISGTFKDWKKTIKLISNSNYFELRYYTEDKIITNYQAEKPNRWFWNISYYSEGLLNETFFGNLTIYTQRLKKIIDIIKNISGKDKVVIIAHSMGGLIARKYMTIDTGCWESVHRILTVNTPNEGVVTSVGIVGQLRDLKKNSIFLTQLESDWDKYSSFLNTKWGVIGSVNLSLWKNYKNPHATDNAGIGYIEISSAIPYGEWSDAVNNFENVNYKTEHFGFRVAVNSNHVKILFHLKTLMGIRWAIEKY